MDAVQLLGRGRDLRQGEEFRAAVDDLLAARSDLRLVAGKDDSLPEVLRMNNENSLGLGEDGEIESADVEHVIDVTPRLFHLGIVGHAADKFTPETEALARRAIRDLIVETRADLVVSGGCHLGGIDQWAVEEARALGVPYVEHKPEKLTWRPKDGSKGFEARNLEIAKDSDLCVSVVVKKLPPGYDGPRFDLCYHCKTTTHVKSGGCWTVKQAIGLGRQGRIIEIGEP